MIRRFQVIRINLSDGSTGLYLGLADATLHMSTEAMSDETGQLGDSLLLECDDQMSIGDLLLLCEEKGRLH